VNFLEFELELSIRGFNVRAKNLQDVSEFTQAIQTMISAYEVFEKSDFSRKGERVG
jgi:hypothetical protein